jgi:hypothetical protein
LVRGPSAAPAIDVATPLASQGILLATSATTPHGVVLFDAGDDHASALAFLASRAPASPPVVVACKGLDVPRINALIAAGAADSIGGLTDAATLAKKLGRVLRRRR